MLKNITGDAIRFYRNNVVKTLYKLSEEFYEEEKKLVLLSPNIKYGDIDGIKYFFLKEKELEPILETFREEWSNKHSMFDIFYDIIEKKRAKKESEMFVIELFRIGRQKTISNSFELCLENLFLEADNKSKVDYNQLHWFETLMFSLRNYFILDFETRKRYFEIVSNSSYVGFIETIPKKSSTPGLQNFLVKEITL